MQLRVPRPRITWRFHRYFFVVLIYFFINSVGLPHGLLYTSLLAPFFYLWLLMKKQQFVLLKFFGALSIFALPQLMNGVEVGSFLMSTAIALTVYLTGYAFYVGIKCLRDPHPIFEQIIHLNFGLSCLGLLFKVTPFAGLMWREADVITANVDPMARFRMFTYEPSYYSTLLLPLVVYAIYRYIHQRSRKNLALMAMTFMPMLMSFSFGVISALIVTLLLAHFPYLPRLLRKKRVLMVVPVLAAMVLYVAVSNNPFKHRLVNVLSGGDTSGNARTVLSYVIASEIIHLKSDVFGVGLGQIKVLGQELIPWGDNRLPSAGAETLAIFGILGLAAKLLLEMFLFVRTRVNTNAFRLSLFLFAFLYQFTGSFLTNIAEYVIWILAFSNVFPEFNAKTPWRLVPRFKLPAPSPMPRLSKGEI